jgi:hypothetical protein
MTTFGQSLQCRLNNKMMFSHMDKLLSKLYTILDEINCQYIYGTECEMLI